MSHDFLSERSPDGLCYIIHSDRPSNRGAPLIRRCQLTSAKGGTIILGHLVHLLAQHVHLCSLIIRTPNLSRSLN